MLECRENERKWVIFSVPAQISYLWLVPTYLIETSVIPIVMASRVLVSVAKVVTSVWAPVQTLSCCTCIVQYTVSLHHQLVII